MGRSTQLLLLSRQCIHSITEQLIRRWVGMLDTTPVYITTLWDAICSGGRLLTWCGRLLITTLHNIRQKRCDDVCGLIRLLTWQVVVRRRCCLVICLDCANLRQRWWGNWKLLLSVGRGIGVRSRGATYRSTSCCCMSRSRRFILSYSCTCSSTFTT